MRADDVLQDVVALANERRIRRYYAYALHGTDLEGNALYIERLGDLDAQALLDDFEIEVLERNHVLSNERCAAVSQKRTVVMDAAGLGSKTLAGLHVLKAFIAIDERYYPETLRRCLIVNAPWVVHATYALVRPWLDAVTAEKIQIVSTSETSDTLLKYIAREQLPDFLGGECKCEKGCVPKAENETTAGH
ncbi:CRAL-TRIO domain-containing protein [Pelagophyceae sp. CCMP2097]|nr:CRAL-TRIO domain-containing protein [Pelagophyceae sp. CCMP2097]